MTKDTSELARKLYDIHSEENGVIRDWNLLSVSQQRPWLFVAKFVQRMGIESKLEELRLIKGQTYYAGPEGAWDKEQRIVTLTADLARLEG